MFEPLKVYCTLKIFKTDTPKIITIIPLTRKQFGFTVQYCIQQDCVDGKANSVDPDQTAPVMSSMIWVCTVCSDLSVPVLRIFMPL